LPPVVGQAAGVDHQVLVALRVVFGHDFSTVLVVDRGRPVAGSTLTAGAYLETVMVCDVEAVLLSMERMTSGYLPAARPGGTWKLIWPAEVSSSRRAGC
jgi:hypothetical protein